MWPLKILSSHCSRFGRKDPKQVSRREHRSETKVFAATTWCTRMCSVGLSDPNKPFAQRLRLPSKNLYINPSFALSMPISWLLLLTSPIMTSSPSPLNVVVVGASCAGLVLANTLAKTLPPTHRIVLIDANPVAFFPIAALRAAVLPGWEEKAIHDLTTASVFGERNTRHVVLSSTRVVGINPEAVIVESDDDVGEFLSEAQQEEGEENRWRIEVDKAVLAVGSTGNFPQRLDNKVTATKEGVIQAFQTMQEEIRAAESILILGGGPTGVEWAGEILDVHPTKRISLVTRAPGLCTRGNGTDRYGGLSAKLVAELKGKGVRLIFTDSIPSDQTRTTGPFGSISTFKTEKEDEVSADYIIHAKLGRPHTSWLAAIDPNLVDPDTGLIRVNSVFRLEAQGWERHFALGDAASTPGKKDGHVAGTHAYSVAYNITADINGVEEIKWKKAKDLPVDILMVPLGKSGGASHIGGWVVGAWFTGWFAGKRLLTNVFEGWFRG